MKVKHNVITTVDMGDYSITISISQKGIRYTRTVSRGKGRGRNKHTLTDTWENIKRQFDDLYKKDAEQ